MPLEEGYTAPSIYSPPKKRVAPRKTTYRPPTTTYKPPAIIPRLEQEAKYGPEPIVQPPKVIIPEIGDDFESLGDKYGVDPLDLAQANADVGGVQAGAALDLPRLGGEQELAFEGDDTRTDKDKWRDMFSDEEWFYFQNLGYDAQVFDEQYYGGVGQGQNRPWGQIIDDETAIFYPEGWNPELFKDFIEGEYNINEEAFMENYLNLDFSEYTPDYLKAPEGITSDAFYDYSGDEWERLAPEAVFDKLYEINGIDPDNIADVKSFWSYADDDLLFMGDYFDAIHWPSGGYGGYSSYDAPSYGGYKPSQDYNRYRAQLQLTSWSI